MSSEDLEDLILALVSFLFEKRNHKETCGFLILFVIDAIGRNKVLCIGNRYSSGRA